MNGVGSELPMLLLRGSLKTTPPAVGTQLHPDAKYKQTRNRKKKGTLLKSTQPTKLVLCYK